MAEIDRSILGVWGPEGTMRVEHGKIAEFARAVKDDNPAYREGEAPPAPPTFLMTIAHWIGDLGQTRRGIKLDYRRLLHGEQDFEYLRPIRAGDVLRYRSRTKDVYEKQGKRGGVMTFVIGETEFRNEAGEVVAYMRNTAIETADSVKE
jgi:acyl dehydratase